MLHAGLAFGAFHRWIYKPAKAGDLSHPLEHKLTTVKAALAAAFVYHELKLALADAQVESDALEAGRPDNRPAEQAPRPCR